MQLFLESWKGVSVLKGSRFGRLGSFFLLFTTKILNCVEEMFLLSVADCFLIRLVKILWQDHVSIFSHCLKSSFRADGTDIRRRDLLAAVDIIFQIQFITQVHFR